MALFESYERRIDKINGVLAQYGIKDVGRVLPADCLYFLGDGKRNHFTNEWQSTDYWGWEMPDPYR